MYRRIKLRVSRARQQQHHRAHAPDRGNGLELYGALPAQGVPSRLVIFPDKNHWALKPQNAIYWHWEMQSWLARFIGGKPTLEKPQFENKDEGKDDKKDATAKPAEVKT